MQKLLWVSGRLRREKKKARVRTPFPLSNVPRTSTIFILINIGFFMESLREPLFRRERERENYVHDFVFFTLGLNSIM